MSLACSNLAVRGESAAKSVMQWWGDVFGLGGRTALLRHFDVKHHERPDSKRRPVSVLALGDCLGHGNLESQSLYAAS